MERGKKSYTKMNYNLNPCWYTKFYKNYLVARYGAVGIENQQSYCSNRDFFDMKTK